MVTKWAAMQPVKTTGSALQIAPRTSDDQVTLNSIKDMLLKINEKITKMEQKISAMKKHMTEGLNLSNETKYIKQISLAIEKGLIVYNIYPSELQLKEVAEEYLIENEADFYESMEDIQWNVFYEYKLAKLLLRSHCASAGTAFRSPATEGEESLTEDKEAEPTSSSSKQGRKQKRTPTTTMTTRSTKKSKSVTIPTSEPTSPVYSEESEYFPQHSHSSEQSHTSKQSHSLEHSQNILLPPRSSSTSTNSPPPLPSPTSSLSNPPPQTCPEYAGHRCPPPQSS
ncbi:12474_t:CDS:2 [Cetraspora pellucida]|uniref:12474_t:CDS:1 n=1 Tax=Cetraspora pellucida TaxID=1433469 RepID=A0ACA9PPB7_9GLOM|nr:12474_t:CDS:2 [Cetraspora pellucida]